MVEMVPSGDTLRIRWFSESAIYRLPFASLTACSGKCSRAVTAGSFLLYSIIGLGSGWLMRIYRRIFGDALSANAEAKSLPARMMKRLNLFSPFMVAGGRLIWLKVPLTITLGVRRDLKVLAPAVALSSIIWDGTYVLVGMVLGNIHTEPPYLVLYSLAVLTLIYGTTFLVRRILTRRALKSSRPA